jgi:hypothetical protein
MGRDNINIVVRSVIHTLHGIEFCRPGKTMSVASFVNYYPEVLTLGNWFCPLH